METKNTWKYTQRNISHTQKHITHTHTETHHTHGNAHNTLTACKKYIISTHTQINIQQMQHSPIRDLCAHMHTCTHTHTHTHTHSHTCGWHWIGGRPLYLQCSPSVNLRGPVACVGQSGCRLDPLFSTPPFSGSGRHSHAMTSAWWKPRFEVRRLSHRVHARSGKPEIACVGARTSSGSRACDVWM